MTRLNALFIIGALGTLGCDRRAPSTAVASDGSVQHTIGVRVPSALMIARAIDSVSVSIDPASVADTTVPADPNMVLGVETECFIYPMNGARPQTGRRGLKSGSDFDVGVSTWTTSTDGLPAQGTKYVAEMTIVLFQTDVPAGHHWDPHAGNYRPLWTRTLRQAEE